MKQVFFVNNLRLILLLDQIMTLTNFYLCIKLETEVLLIPPL